MTPDTSELNGDLKLSPVDRLRYLWRNAVRNLEAGWRPRSSAAFMPPVAEAMRWFRGQSPSRLLTEAFFETLPARFPVREVDVLEIGCGSGSMTARLSRLGYSGRYTGVDIADRFEREGIAGERFERRFVQSDAHQFKPPRPVDMIVSVSTLEHIPRDAALIQRLSATVAAGGIEIHAVPSRSALLAYLWHGYRQYSAEDLRVRFPGRAIEVLRLGGFATFLVHILMITPEIFVGKFIRARWPDVYRRAIALALTLDRVLPFCPTAYVVICRH